MAKEKVYQAKIGKKTEPKTISELQELFPKGKLIVLPAKLDEDEETVILPSKQFFLDKPGRGTIKYAQTQTITGEGKIDAITPGGIVLEKCWVAGDDEINADDAYYFRACMEANGFLNETMGF